LGNLESNIARIRQGIFYVNTKLAEAYHLLVTAMSFSVATVHGKKGVVYGQVLLDNA
jgi:hypothetical protein